jgi:glycerol kinase
MLFRLGLSPLANYAQVDRPEIFETTALGAGYLAGWQAGLYPRPGQFAKTWRRQASFTVDGAS